MRILSLISLFFVSATAQAVSVESCDSWKSKAGQFMEWRQQGIPISQAVKDTSGNVSRGLLLRAYAEPKAEDYEAQFFAVQDFSEKVYDECLAAKQEHAE